jgi:hypothetical protein
MKQLILLIFALLVLCGCGYKVDTPGGTKRMSLNEALAIADSLGAYRKLEMQAGLWDADVWLIIRKRREFYVGKHPEINQRFKELILNGQIAIGMTEEQVLASWGWPWDSNKTVGQWGIYEQWIYGSISYGSMTFLYFENGSLTSWQD